MSYQRWRGQEAGYWTHSRRRECEPQERVSWAVRRPQESRGCQAWPSPPWPRLSAERRGALVPNGYCTGLARALPGLATDNREAFRRISNPDGTNTLKVSLMWDPKRIYEDRTHQPPVPTVRRDDMPVVTQRPARRYQAIRRPRRKPRKKHRRGMDVDTGQHYGSTLARQELRSFWGSRAPP